MGVPPTLQPAPVAPASAAPALNNAISAALSQPQGLHYNKASLEGSNMPPNSTPAFGSTSKVPLATVDTNTDQLHYSTKVSAAGEALLLLDLVVLS
jgi:hypothetical protein